MKLSEQTSLLLPKFDWDRFEERAAILEYDEGLTRDRAELEAARRQGYEFLNYNDFEAWRAQQWKQCLSFSAT